ncbi:putative glycosyltransferase At5g03795 isoform X1 [Wolffia australiana]
MSKPNACTACWGDGGGRRRGGSSSLKLAAFTAVVMAASVAAVILLNFAPNLSSSPSASFSFPSSFWSLKNSPSQRRNPLTDQSEALPEQKIEEEEEEKKKQEKTEEEQAGAGLQLNQTTSPLTTSMTTTAPSPAKSPSGSNAERDRSLSRLEEKLARARYSIKLASKDQKNSSSLRPDSYVPYGPIYKNPNAFHRSYLEMEKSFRVFVYEEGDPPLFHDGPCRSIYSSEGRFIYAMESGNTFRTSNPEQAHVFFLPFSVAKMVKFVYQPESFDIRPMKKTIADYVNIIAQKYRYWNRSMGADHFILSCHDWAPKASSADTHLHQNSIRVLCNANTSEGFNPLKDVSLPEINLKNDHTAGIIGGPSPSQRPVLAFFAGGLHGPIRPLLLKHWKNKDDDMQVFEYLPKGVSYYDMMKKAKFCICPSGYEVASPRIVEAIYFECVPVVISDGYVLPFSDVLNWKSFSIQVETKDIPTLKKILLAVSPRAFIRMQRRMQLVQRHFVVNSPPKRFDVFHMILHSIWLRRLNVRVNPAVAGM